MTRDIERSVRRTSTGRFARCLRAHRPGRSEWKTDRALVAAEDLSRLHAQ